MTRILTIAKFRAWLESRPDDWVYRPRSYCDCPLALYLQDAMSAPDYRVDGLRCFRNAGRTLQLPKWAKQFVSDLDHRVTVFQTKAAALSALDEVRRS